MLKNLGEAIESFGKLTPVPLLALGLAAGMVLFSTDRFAATLGMSQFRDTHRFWIGLVFVVSWCYLLAYSVWWGRDKIISKYRAWRTKRNMEESLHELTPEEKECLLPYIRDAKNTRYFDCTDGVVGGLLAKKILFRSSNLITPDAVPYNLQPWARKYLQEHPEVLQVD